MKTALTQYIEYLEGIKERDSIPNHVITTAKNYLSIEKQQIIDAYNSGWQYGFLANSNELQPTKNSETYFSETYTTNKETLK